MEKSVENYKADYKNITIKDILYGRNPKNFNSSIITQGICPLYLRAYFFGSCEFYM